jgi:hypothetical protein
MEMSFTSLGSSHTCNRAAWGLGGDAAGMGARASAMYSFQTGEPTFLRPQPRTEAASRFCSLRLTMAAIDACAAFLTAPQRQKRAIQGPGPGKGGVRAWVALL